ncbi:MAG: nucleoside deaminase [Bacteroidales bacterium]
MDVFTDEYFMRKAIEQAEIARLKGEVPVGAVVVADNTVIAKAYNMTETLKDVTAHAEMQAITMAANFLGGKYLTGCIMYVTLEPCSMCAGALKWSQISKLVYGASDTKNGMGMHEGLFHPKTAIKSEVLAKECEELIKNFFKEKR